MDVDTLQYGAYVTEMSCVHFFQVSGLFQGNFDELCGTKMKLVLRKQKSGNFSAHWRCFRKTCRFMRSIRSNSNFIPYEDSLDSR